MANWQGLNTPRVKNIYGREHFTYDIVGVGACTPTESFVVDLSQLANEVIITYYAQQGDGTTLMQPVLARTAAGLTSATSLDRETNLIEADAKPLERDQLSMILPDRQLFIRPAPANNLSNIRISFTIVSGHQV